MKKKNKEILHRKLSRDFSMTTKKLTKKEKKTYVLHVLDVYI